MEAFDEADRALLQALASVGAVALANAELYAEVRRQRERLSVITGSLGEGVCAVSEDGRITFMNPAGAGMLGWHGVETNGKGALVPGTEAPDFLREPALRAIALGRNVTSYDSLFAHRDGSHFPVAMTASPVMGGPAAAGAVIVFRDTSERKAFEDQLARHAFQDALTGLANRRLLLDHLDHALLQAKRTRSTVALLFCDIDRFKVVNDNLGHQLGDELLRVIAERLRRAVRPGDTLSRFGGDEFVVILEGVASPDEAGDVADAILESLRDPITLRDGHEVMATVSIGIALSEEDTSRDDLLQNADMAMYRAKERGRGGQFTLFDVDRVGVGSLNPLDLDTALRHVVDRGEIEVHYQPLVSLADRRIVGAEALVRWNHPEHGILLPAHFVKLAEDNGTIVPIDGLVLEQACRQGQIWQQEFGVTLQVAVNVSARQFQHATPGRRGRRRPAGDRPRPRTALPRNHRGTGHGRHRPDVERPGDAAHPRRPGGHRRLRDGPLVPRLAGPFPHRRREDRPRLRPRHRTRPGEGCHRLGGGGTLERHRFRHRGRGGGDAAPARGARASRV